MSTEIHRKRCGTRTSFQPIQVAEPTTDEATQILFGLRDRYEAHHRVTITDEAIQEAVTLSDRYILDRFLPDKAIDLIDEAASKVRLRSYTAPPNLKEVEAKLEGIRKDKDEAVQSQEFEKAASLRDTEQKLRDELERLKEEWQNKQGNEKLEVTKDDIAQVVANWTGVPVTKIAEEETDRLLRLEEILHGRVIGQNEAVKSISKSHPSCTCRLKRSKTSDWFIHLPRTNRCR